MGVRRQTRRPGAGVAVLKALRWASWPRLADRLLLTGADGSTTIHRIYTARAPVGARPALFASRHSAAARIGDAAGPGNASGRAPDLFRARARADRGD